jgi:hypothetical protein
LCFRQSGKFFAIRISPISNFGDVGILTAMTRHRIDHKDIPPVLRGWIVTSDHQLPRFWATVWSDILNANISDATRAANLAAVDKLSAVVNEERVLCHLLLLAWGLEPSPLGRHEMCLLVLRAELTIDKKTLGADDLAVHERVFFGRPVISFEFVGNVVLAYGAPGFLECLVVLLVLIQGYILSNQLGGRFKAAHDRTWRAWLSRIT